HTRTHTHTETYTHTDTHTDTHSTQENRDTHTCIHQNDAFCIPACRHVHTHTHTQTYSYSSTHDGGNKLTHKLYTFTSTLIPTFALLLTTMTHTNTFYI